MSTTFLDLFYSSQISPSQFVLTFQIKPQNKVSCQRKETHSQWLWVTPCFIWRSYRHHFLLDSSILSLCHQQHTYLLSLSSKLYPLSVLSLDPPGLLALISSLYPWSHLSPPSSASSTCCIENRLSCEDVINCRTRDSLLGQSCAGKCSTPSPWWNHPPSKPTITENLSFLNSWPLASGCPKISAEEKATNWNPI